MNFIIEDIMTYVKLNVMTRSPSLPIEVEIDTIFKQVHIKT